MYEISNDFFDDDGLGMIDKRMIEFGQCGVIISNPKVFIEKIENELNRLDLKFEIHKVEYSDLKKLGELKPTPFDKNNSFLHQRELRIIIPNEIDEVKLISVGCLESVCQKFDFGYVLDSKGITEMKWKAKKVGDTK